MKTLLGYTLGIIAIGIALWGSAKLDEAREKAVKDCTRWEVDFNNQITCVEYE